MGREIKETDETEKQRDELRKLYASVILDAPSSERHDAYRTVTDQCIRFLNAANPSSRLDPVISDVIRRSAQSETRPWVPGQTAEALRHMEFYALNLWDFPWKTEFHTITMFSGFFKIKIENKICQPDDILLLLGYKKVVNCFQLVKMPPREEVSHVAFDLFLASLECSEMEKVVNAVKPIGISSSLVYEVRREVLGDTRVCADHVREKFRLVKSGHGRSTGKSSLTSIGQPPQGKAPMEGERKPVVDAGEVVGSKVEGGKVVGSKVEGGDVVGSKLEGGRKVTQNEEKRKSNIGIGKCGVEEKTPNHGGPLELKTLPAEGKFTTKAPIKSTALPETWQVTADVETSAHTEALENVYDAVEDVQRVESVYYGFPSMEKPQLGSLKANGKEKKDQVPSRVSGGAMWSQENEASSNLSFSTFRQEKARPCGTEYKDPSFRANDSSLRMNDSPFRANDSSLRMNDSRGATPKAHLRGRSVVGPGHDPEKPGFRGGDIHPYCGGVSVDSNGKDDDSMSSILHLDPEQMKDRTVRRQVMEKLDPSFTRVADPCWSYQSWNCQHSDLPAPPPSAFSSGSALSFPGHSGSGKTRDPWRSDDVWQCGSCSYENSSLDDACKMCNTTRYL